MVTVLGSIAVLQALSFLIVLYRQELWLNLILIPRPGSVKGVRTCSLLQPSAPLLSLYAAACPLRLLNRLQLAPCALSFWIPTWLSVDPYTEAHAPAHEVHAGPR